MSKSIGVALLSFAHNHQFHWARALSAHPDVHLAGAWDSQPERGRAGAEAVNVEFEPDLERLLTRDDVDAAAICSETASHAPLAVKAAEHGKHVLCEKPMALGLPQCRDMIGAASESGVVYMQAFPQRHMRSNHAILGHLQAGTLGAVSLVRKRHGHAFGLGTLAADMPWIVDREQAGAGGFLDEGIHECDVLRWFLGDPVSVQASIGNTLPSMAERGIDDFGAAIFSFAGGEKAVLESGWTWLAGGPTTEIYGSKGSLAQNCTDLTAHRMPLPGVTKLQLYLEAEQASGWQALDVDDEFSQAHERVAHAFADCLQSGHAPEVTGEDGKKAVEMMLGAYMSAVQGREIFFPLTGSESFPL